MSTSFREGCPLLVQPLPALPRPDRIHGRSDEPPALDLPLVPGVGEEILDALPGATSGPAPRVVSRRPCHSHPSQREGRALGLPPMCQEQTPRLLHAAMGRSQPSIVHRLAVSTQVTQ